MRKLVVISIFAVGLVLGVFATSTRVGDAHAATAASQRWEYNCSQTLRSEDKNHHPVMQVLNHLGQQGWELVAIDPSNGHFCFKRPLH